MPQTVKKCGELLFLVLMSLVMITMMGFFQGNAQAVSSFRTQFQNTYPAARGSQIDSCSLCHTSAPNLNVYGQAWSNGDFRSIESQDSDRDGASNIDEIKALTFPGNASSKPVVTPPPVEPPPVVTPPVEPPPVVEPPVVVPPVEPPPVVTPPENSAPKADAGMDQVVEAEETVVLDGSGSFDKEGDLKFQWNQTSGPNVNMGKANRAKVKFFAPETRGGAKLVFKLTVTDGEGLRASDSVSVFVLPDHDREDEERECRDDD